jgi:hypothetical protein
VLNASIKKQRKQSFPTGTAGVGSTAGVGARGGGGGGGSVGRSGANKPLQSQHSPHHDRYDDEGLASNSHLAGGSAEPGRKHRHRRTGKTSSAASADHTFDESGSIPWWAVDVDEDYIDANGEEYQIQAWAAPAAGVLANGPKRKLKLKCPNPALLNGGAVLVVL